MSKNINIQRKKVKQSGKFQENRIFIINDPTAPRLVPALAKEIGLNESILFLQIEFWIAITDNVRDGRKWTYQSTSNIQATFPFWSESTIKRAVKSLKEKKLILTDNYNKLSFDKTTWFAINLEEAAKLNSISIVENGHSAILADTEKYDAEESSTANNELSVIEEKIWRKFEVINPLAPVDKLQKDAVRQLANHILNGKASINDIISTAGILSGSDFYMTPLVPTTILKHINEWRYKEVEGLDLRFDDLYEIDDNDSILF